MQSLFSSSSKHPKSPIYIAGPCSAESPEQLLMVANAIKGKADFLRAGTWKPRSRPNSFEGMGEEALVWLKEVKKECGMSIATEVANPQHAETALKYGVDLLWIGARTSVNPFITQEIAESLKGVQVKVLVKNPINPELNLWLGAIERFINAGIKDTGAIHRGFSSYEKTRYRNSPYWQIAIELKRIMPEIVLLGDPSHISGKASLIKETAQKIFDLNYDGLMVEVHPSPETALSDKEQQITPAQYLQLLSELEIRTSTSTNVLFNSKLEDLRSKIDTLDKELLDILSNRQRIVTEIGEFKKENNVSVFQLERWQEIINTRPEWAKEMDVDYVKALFQLIHDQSIKVQTSIFNNELHD